MTRTPIERLLHFASCIRLDHKLSRIETAQNRATNDVSEALPIVYLARHGETAWTISGRHTSFTDLTLTERGERNARRLQKRLRGSSFAKIFTSPLQRARRTCELAGFASVAQIDPVLAEWNYGEYEGRMTADIHKERPDWQIFRDGCPGGESLSEVGVRADRAIKRLRAVEGNVLLFSSGHFLRVLTARWLGLEPPANSSFEHSEPECTEL